MSIEKLPQCTRLHGVVTEEVAYVLCGGEIIVQMVRRENDACEVEYVLRPDWVIIDRLKAQGIYINDFPGISLIPSERKAEYIKDHTPSYIRRNTLPRGRRDIAEYCERFGYPEGVAYDPWTFLLITHGEHQNDGFTVYQERELRDKGIWKGFPCSK